MSNQVEMDVDIEITPKIEKFLDEVGELFDAEKVEEIARNTGFVKRKSKLTGYLFLVVFTFAMNTYGTPTLKQLVGLLKLVALVKIKREGFYQRIKEEAVVFFQKMLSEAVKINVSKVLDVNILNVFERVIILDSIVFQLPEELAEYFRGSGGSLKNQPSKFNLATISNQVNFFMFCKMALVQITVIKIAL